MLRLVCWLVLFVLVLVSLHHARAILQRARTIRRADPVVMEHELRRDVGGVYAAR